MTQKSRTCSFVAGIQGLETSTVSTLINTAELLLKITLIHGTYYLIYLILAISLGSSLFLIQGLGEFSRAAADSKEISLHYFLML